MEIAALALGALALVVALLRRGASAADLEDAKRDARRRVENLGGELRAELETTRKLLAEVASGAQLDPDQIAEGRLWRDVSPPDGQSMVEGGSCRVLDVRTPQETAAGVIPGAILIPVDQLEGRLSELPKDGTPLLVTCAAGGRSAAACEFLSSQGFSGLLNLEGGMSSWAGPVARS